MTLFVEIWPIASAMLGLFSAARKGSQVFDSVQVLGVVPGRTHGAMPVGAFNVIHTLSEQMMARTTLDAARPEQLRLRRFRWVVAGTTRNTGRRIRHAPTDVRFDHRW
jgi:hypothetical protein